MNFKAKPDAGLIDLDNKELRVESASILLNVTHQFGYDLLS